MDLEEEMSKRRREPGPVEPTLFAEESTKAETRTMYSLPPRFRAMADMDGGFVTLTDNESGQTVKIAPGAFGEVRRVLGAFFGGREEEETDFVPREAAAEAPVAPPAAPAPAPASVAAEEPPVAPAAAAPARKRGGKAAASPAAEAREADNRDWEAAAPPSPPAAASPPPAAPSAPAAKPLAASAKAPAAPAAAEAAAGELPEGWEREYRQDGYVLEFAPKAREDWPGYLILVDGKEQGRVWREVLQPIRKPLGREARIRFMVSYSGDDEIFVHRNMIGVHSRLDVKFGPNND